MRLWDGPVSPRRAPCGKEQPSGVLCAAWAPSGSEHPEGKFRGTGQTPLCLTQVKTKSQGVGLGWWHGSAKVGVIRIFISPFCRISGNISWLIPAVSESDEGFYECTATSKVGVTRARSYVSVSGGGCLCQTSEPFPCQQPGTGSSQPGIPCLQSHHRVSSPRATSRPHRARPCSCPAWFWGMCPTT